MSVIHNYFRSKYFQSEEAELFFCKLYITQWLKISSIVSFLNIASRASYIFLYEKDLNFRAKNQDFIYWCIFWPFLGQNCKMRHFWVIFKQFSISFQMSSQPYFWNVKFFSDNSRVGILHHFPSSKISIWDFLSFLLFDTNDYHDIPLLADGTTDKKNDIFWQKYRSSWGKQTSSIQESYFENVR